MVTPTLNAEDCTSWLNFAWYQCTQRDKIYKFTKSTQFNRGSAIFY